MSSLFPNGIKGLSDTKWSGVAGSAAKLIGIDYRTKPGIITAHQKLAKNSPNSPDANEVSELCKVGIPASDGSTLWFSSTSGKIWREIGGVWTLVYTLNPVADFNQYDAFEKAFPNETPATIWKTFTETTLINYSSGCILAPSGSDIPVLTARAIGRGSGSSGTLSTTIEVPNESNQVVVVITGSYTANGVSGITFDGNAMTNVINGTASSGSFNIGHTLRYYINPTAGTRTVTTTFASSSSNRFLYVMVFKNVHQTVPVVDNDNGFGEETDPALATLDLVATANNQLLIMGTYTPTGTHIMGAGETEILNSGSFSSVMAFDESIAIKQFSVGTPSILSAAEFNGDAEYVVDDFDVDSLEPVLVENVPFIYFANSAILWKIPVSELSSWTGNVTSAGTFQNGNDTYHPMVVQNLQLFIGDGNVIAKVNELLQFVPETELNVEKNETITSMISFDIDILIGTKNVNRCRVIRWDTVSESWSAEDVINDVEVYAFIRDDNYVYALVGDAGRLYFYNGEKLIPYQRIPGEWSPTSKGKINANAVGFLLGTPVFGFSNTTGNPTEQGVYGFGSYSKDYPKTLSLDYPLSTGTFENIEIGAVLTKGADMWVSWKSGSGPTYGVDKLDWSNKYTDAHVETTMLSPIENRTEFKTVARTMAPYASLPNDTAIVLGYKKNYEDTYNTFASVVDAKHKTVKADKSVPEIGNFQLRLGLTVDGNDAPEVEDFQFEFVAEVTQIKP